MPCSYELRCGTGVLRKSEGRVLKIHLSTNRKPPNLDDRSPAIPPFGLPVWMPGCRKEDRALVISDSPNETRCTSQSKYSLKSGHKSPQWFATGPGAADASDPFGFPKGVR